MRAVIPERAAMLITGRKTDPVFERHNILSEDDLDMAAQRLDNAASTVSSTVGNSDLKSNFIGKRQVKGNQSHKSYAPVAQVDRATVS